jgi:hypothetical protein
MGQTELRNDGVLGSSAHAPVPPWDMMYPLRKEPGKRALLAFFIDGRYRASHPTALAVGATAVGILAIGALAIRALAVKRGRIERLNIEELEVGRYM